ELDAVGVDAGVSGGTRAFERKGESCFAVLDRLPEDLRVAEEHHPIWPQVVEDIGEDVDVHEGTPELAAAEPPPLPVREAQVERRLSGVFALAQHVELD